MKRNEMSFVTREIHPRALYFFLFLTLFLSFHVHGCGNDGTDGKVTGVEINGCQFAWFQEQYVKYCSLYSMIEETRDRVDEFLRSYPDKDKWTEEQSNEFSSLRNKSGKLVKEVVFIRTQYNKASEVAPRDFDWRELPEQLQ